MSKTSFSLRSSLFLGAATAAALSVSPVYADSVETVVVTGSRIPQQGVVSSTPVTMVSQEEIKLQGTTDVGTLMNNLPSVFAGQTAGTGNGSSGTITVDLRGLGSARTLVLIDGRRMGPGDPEVPVPDLNQIPAALIEHTEVLTGGASAVYGSDALAGVVNFIMRKDFEGVELDVNAGIYQHDNNNSELRGLQDAAGFTKAPSTVWDGESFDATLILGTNTANGKGNVTAYIGYQRQAQVLGSQRDLSACSLSNAKKGTTSITLTGGASKTVSNYNKIKCAGSINYSLFVSETGPKAWYYYFMEKGGNLSYFAWGDPTEYFNYGAYNTIIRPQTRYSGGMFAHYEVDKMLDIYATFMFTDTHNSWQAAPSAAFFGSAASTDGSLTVSCDQPYVTSQFVSYFCPDADGDGSGDVYDTSGTAQSAQVYMGRRNVEGGGRVTDFRHTSYRAVIGARGDLGDGWSYDLYAMNSTALYQQLYLYDWSKAAVQNSLIYDASTGTCASGTCIDLFHGIGGMTSNMLDAVYTHGQRTGTTTEQVVSATITGDLGTYGIKSPWAVEGVGISGGVEYRNDTLEEITSAADYSGDLFGAGSAALGQELSSVHVWEIFGETRIPLIHGMPYIEDLSLNAGYRWSTYSTSGAKAVHSYKYGAEWQPIDDFRVRVGMQRAVRAPSILDLFSPTNSVLGSYTDPCAGKTPTGTLAQCELTGVSASDYGTGAVIQCPASQCYYLSGGNTALKPEKSNTKTLGFVFTPTFISGLTFTVDYFNIDVKDYVGSIPQTVVLAQCMSGTLSSCALIHRSTATGGFATSDGYIDGTLQNTGYLKTKGMDFELNYMTPVSDFGLGDNGSLSLNVFGTYVSDYRVQPYSGANEDGYVDYNCVGLYGVSCGTPTMSWRHKARITWSTPWDLDMSLNWRHMSGSKFDSNSTNPFLQDTSAYVGVGGKNHIPAYDYFDVAFSYQYSDGVNLTLGVNNILDKDPPTLVTGGKTSGPTAWTNGNTFNGVYDSLGRYLFMAIKLKS